jgi:hypothetical protein
VDIEIDNRSPMISLAPYSSGACAATSLSSARMRRIRNSSTALKVLWVTTENSEIWIYRVAAVADVRSDTRYRFSTPLDLTTGQFFQVTHYQQRRAYRRQVE